MKKKIHIQTAVYGAYAVLCHMCSIMLYFFINKTDLPQELLARRCAEMLEYSVMSGTIILIGTFLLYYCTVKENI